MIYDIKTRPQAEIRGVKCYLGVSLEEKLRRIANDNEAIETTDQMIYANRTDGKIEGTDIREDRFDKAIEAMDIVSRAKVAQRDNRIKIKEEELSKKALEGMRKEGEA